MVEVVIIAFVRCGHLMKHHLSTFYFTKHYIADGHGFQPSSDPTADQTTEVLDSQVALHCPLEVPQALAQRIFWTHHEDRLRASRCHRIYCWAVRTVIMASVESVLALPLSSC